jgi:hypothetical protein
VSKKPISLGKNHKIKERLYEICFAGLFHRTNPENPAKGGKACLAGRQAPQSGANILSGLSVSIFTFTPDISSQKALIMGVNLRWARKLGSGFPPYSRTGQPIRWTSQPEGLIRPTSQSDGLTPMSAFPSGKYTYQKGLVDGFLEKSANLLIISDFYSQLVYKYYGVRELTSFGCRFFVDKKFELRSEVCDKHKKRLAQKCRLLFLEDVSNLFE